MYGVVVCPRCGRAKGVELPKKTTTCQCGFTIMVRPSAIKFESSSGREMAAAVGRINADLRGGTEEVRKFAAKPKKRSRDAYARIVESASRAGDRRHRIRAAAEGLASEFVLFSIEDWQRVMEALGISQTAESLEELVRGNVVYEPKPGYYRTV